MPVDRPVLLRRAIALEWFTVAWMIVEAAVGVWAGVAVNSLSIMAFGIDSVIELASAAVLLWRLIAELHQHAAFAEVTEQTARRLAGVLLLALAAYIVAGAAWRLWNRSGQNFSLAGLVIVVIAVPLMYVLAHRKMTLADALESRALHADAVQSIACGYLSFAVAVGLLAQLAVGAWWVDVATSVAILYFVIQEGREALAGEDHDGEPSGTP
ncbi:MAG: cation transporter [Alphaproteobacteria bacterium]|nr:cation transporter [Alphaproteobacteria bacterium]